MPAWRRWRRRTTPAACRGRARRRRRRPRSSGRRLAATPRPSRRTPAGTPAARQRDARPGRPARPRAAPPSLRPSDSGRGPGRRRRRRRRRSARAAASGRGRMTSGRRRSSVPGEWNRILRHETTRIPRRGGRDRPGGISAAAGASTDPAPEPGQAGPVADRLRRRHQAVVRRPVPRGRAARRPRLRFDQRRGLADAAQARAQADAGQHRRRGLSQRHHPPGGARQDRGVDSPAHRPVREERGAHHHHRRWAAEGHAVRAGGRERGTRSSTASRASWKSATSRLPSRT